MKKKGLIISTVAMVVVLIAALSTATFAWFSSTAQATISNVTINTTAAEGLQIGVKTTDTVTYPSKYVKDTITYNSGVFGGSDGLGSLADFTNLRDALGTMDHAVTKVVNQTGRYIINAKDAETFTFEVFGSVSMYDAATAGINVWAGTGTEAEWNTAVGDGGEMFGKETLYADYVKGDFLAATKYNDKMEPLFYRPAVVNGKGTKGTADYLSLPIGVQSTLNVQAIICELKITPDVSKITKANYAPGMAAAAYININDGTNDVLVQAYPDVKWTGSGATGSTTTPSWSYYFVVAYGSTAENLIESGKPIDLTYTIWIEGMDTMCVNDTAGSGFNVDILYKYEKNFDNISGAIVDYNSTDKTDGSLVVKGNTANAGGSENRTYIVNILSKKNPVFD